MNTRIDQKFAELKAAGKKGFIAYITAGDPTLKATEDTVLRLEDIGTDVVELGVPFSDPLADGTANQLAAERALTAGATWKGIMESVRNIRKRSEIPLVLYTYMNPLYAHGFATAVKTAHQAGIDGCLIVDLPVEEAGPYRKALDTHLVNTINLITPTTPDDRIKAIVKISNGFVYCVSRAGVTGEQKTVQGDALPLLKRIHRHTKLPVALGFGVSTPQQARAYADLTEAVVVGSYIVTQYHQAGNSARGRAAASQKIKKLVDAVKEI